MTGQMLSSTGAFAHEICRHRRHLLWSFLPAHVELLEVGNEVVDPLLVLEPGIDHLGAGDLGPRVLDVIPEGGLVPGET